MVEGEAKATCNPVLTDESYRQLRSLATAYMSRERPDHTLQPTALVHEAIVRMSRHSPVEAMERTALMSVAALAMRHVLVESARRRRVLKRGGSGERVPLDDTVVRVDGRDVDLVDLDDALERLALMDELLGRIVELRFFGGMTIEEAAAALGVSTRTVERGWRFARLWLYRRLSAECPGRG